MNRKFGLIAAAVTALALCACESTPKSLVVFYSQNGATKKVAEIFQKSRNADVRSPNHSPVPLPERRMLPHHWVE